jgi:hypothetical protein
MKPISIRRNWLAGRGASTVFVAALVIVAGAPAVLAQGTRDSLERHREAMCAKADVDGDSYRPFVCDPRCDCLSSGEIAQATNCSETAPGIFEVVVMPQGVCGDACVSANGSSVCASSSFDSCTASCSNPGEICVVNTCVRFCTDHDDCTAPVNTHCTNKPIDCATDDDCAPGDTCNVGKCMGVACTQDSDCASTHELAGVSAPDSPTPATCQPESGDPITINTNDALECIAQAEAAIGQACTPFTP